MDKSKIGIILSSILSIILLFSAIYFEFLKTYDFASEITKITPKTKLIDYNTDHNQALDVAQYAKNKGLKIPKILINFDTHSDIVMNFPVVSWGESSIENWINEYIAKYPDVNEIYWVMPKEEAQNFRIQISLAQPRLEDFELGAPLAGNCIDKNFPVTKFIFKPLYKEPFIQTFLMDPETGKMNEFIEDQEITKQLFDPNIKYKKVKIITCTEETLPDFKNKDVFLSIDADYISNSGFDTDEGWANNRNNPEMNRALFKMLQTINNKNIRPEIISLSLSPQYLPKEDHKFMTKFFKYFINSAGKTDEIHIYKNKLNYDNRIPYQMKYMK